MGVPRIKRRDDEDQQPANMSVERIPPQTPVQPETNKGLGSFIIDFGKGVVNTIGSAIRGISSLSPIDYEGLPGVTQETIDQQNRTEQQTRNFIKRIGTSALDMVSDALDFGGDFIANNPEVLTLAGPMAPLGLTNLTQAAAGINTPGVQLRNAWKDFYNELDDKGYTSTEALQRAVDRLNDSVAVQPTIEWQSAPLREKLTDRLPETMFMMGPNIISSLGLFAINPAVGAIAAGGSTADAVKEDAIAYGVPRDTAEGLGLATGIAVGYFDRIVPNRLFGSGAAKQSFVNNFARRIVETGFLEAGTEMAQEDLQIIAELTFRNDLGWDEVKTRNAMAGLGGLFGGVGAQGTVDFANMIRSGEIPVGLGLSIKEVGDGEQIAPENIEDTLNQIEAEIERQREEFRKEAGLMASTEGAGVRRRVVEDATGNVDFVANDFSLNRAKADMARQAESLKKYANELLYENNSTYRKLVDDRDKILERRVYQGDTSVIPFLDDEIEQLENNINAYGDEAITLEPETIRALERATQGSRGVDTLKQAERINRPATVGETRAAVRSIKPEPSRFIRQRETTLLKQRIRQIQKSAKSEAQKKAEISRLENKFENRIEKAVRKEQLKTLRTGITQRMKGIARGVREGTISTRRQIQQAQTELIQAIESSNLEAKDRAKFIRTIKNIQTPQQLQDAMPKIEERIGRLENQADVRKLRNKIKAELKKTKVRKQSGKPVGKFTPEIQAILDAARQAFSLTVEQAQAKIAENLEKNPDIPPPEVAMQNRILSMMSGDLSVQELETLLSDIQTMKETGQVMNSLKKFNISSEVEALRGTVVERVTGGEGIKPGTETFSERETSRQRIKKQLKTLGKRWIVDWQGQMQILEFNNAAGDNVLADMFSTLDQDNEYKMRQHAFNENIKNAVVDAYGIANKETAVHAKLGDLSEEINLGTFKNRDGIEQELVMTKDEIIKRWMELQDLTLQESFIEGNRYTPEIIEAIENTMTDQDKKFAQNQFEMYLRQWEEINPVYRELYGVDLPFNETYSPIRRKGFKIDESKAMGEFLGENVQRKALSTGSLKSRVKNALPIETVGSIRALERHFTETNYFVSWAFKIREMRAVFTDNEVKAAIEQEFGRDMNKAIGNSIDDFTTNGNRAARRYAIVDAFRKKFTLGALMIKPAIGVKQMISTLAYLEKLGPAEFTAGVADFFSNPIKNAKILNEESALIKTRGANIERDIRAAMESDSFKRFSKTQSFINTAMMNVQLGDKGAILVGSWAMRRAALKRDIPLDQAIRAYEDFSASTQQSSDLSRLSEVQKGGSFEQLFTMFKSSPRQYMAKELNAIRSLFQKGGTTPKNIAKVARILVIYHVLLPVVFQYVANLGGWDEEDKKEYLRAGILGSANGIFIFGDFIDAGLRAAMGMRVWDTELPMADIFVDIGSAASIISDDDITNEDVFDALDELSSAGNYIGLPVDQAKTMLSGVGDIIEGDTKVGLAKLLGWSPYHAEGLSDKPTSRRGTQERLTAPARSSGSRSSGSVVPRVRRSTAPSGGVPRIR